jgi:ATP-binding cassette subfamily B (MDR/TAP) protein 1
MIGIFIRDLLTYFVGEEITSNIRKDTYQKILKMPIYWFDRTENNTGILSTRLGTDCQTINGMATTYIYIMLQTISTLVAAIIIAFIFEWRTAFVAIGTMPVIIVAGAIRSKFRNGQMEEMDKAYKDSALIIMESLTNIRTVVSFGVENTVQNKYERYLDKPQESLQKSAIISGFFFGLGQVVNFIAFGFMFFIGTIFMRDFGIELLDVFTVVYVILFAGITMGNNSNFLPDIGEAKLSAAHIF